MKKVILIALTFAFLLASSISFGQTSKKTKLIQEGIALHDAKKYKQAIKKYDASIKIDDENISAWYEKALSYYAWGKYQEAIDACKQAKKVDPESETMKQVYMIEANSWDDLGEAGKAIDIYEKGIEAFSEYHMLYFNKGITEIQNDRLEDCNESFKKAIELEPDHSGSYNGLAVYNSIEGNKIPKIFMLARYLIISPKSSRAPANLIKLEEVTTKAATKTGRNSISITLSSISSDEDVDSTVVVEDDFSSMEMTLTLSSTLNLSSKERKETDADRLASMMETLCNLLKENQEGQIGYYWERYVPYFLEMQEEGMLETFAYIAYASSTNKKIQKWLKNNGSAIKKFYDWDEEYEWKNV